MSEEINAWKIMKNLKTPLDFIKMLYCDEYVEQECQLLKSLNMKHTVSLDNYDCCDNFDFDDETTLHAQVNDLYMRLRILGLDVDTVKEIMDYNYKKILKWKYEFLFKNNISDNKSTRKF